MSVSPSRILEYLRALSGMTTHLWLTGGVAVDFLVGGWTRQHKDVDLVALSSTRKFLRGELTSRNFRLVKDDTWSTHWALDGDGAVEPGVEIVFVEPAQPNTGVLVVPESVRFVGRPGRYPLPPDCLDPMRFATLDGVRFRVCSPEGEWLARTTSGALFPGRIMEPKIVHDLGLLEGLVPAARRHNLLETCGIGVTAP